MTRFSARHRLSPVCIENSVLIDYVTEPPNVSGCHARISVKFRKLFSARVRRISKRTNRFHMKRNRRERVRGAHRVESVAPLPDHALPRKLDSRSRQSLLPLYQRLAGRPSAPPRGHFRWGVIRSLSFIPPPPFVHLQVP